jgi:hypothetical protein
MQVNGWTYDPARRLWFADASDGIRWLALDGGPDDAPAFRPDAFLPA